MKIAFFWTGNFSKNIFEELHNSDDFEIKLVVSQPDKQVWRKRILKETEVKVFSKEKSIEVRQPIKIREDKDIIKKLKELKLDFIIVVAYGQIISQEILDIPKYWCINIHGSILPKYRGASPIQEAIKNWETETGITIMYMNEKMDEWDILGIKKIKIDNEDKTIDVFKKMEIVWPDFLKKILGNVVKWLIKPIKQDNDEATYCKKIKKENWEIYFLTQKANTIYSTYRAYSSWPWIYTYYKWKKFNIEECCFSNIGEYENNYIGELLPWKVIKINKKTLWVVCSDKKILILNRVKLEWKKTMDILSFINWNKDFLEYNFSIS